jgi:hypothetical protein
MGFGALLSILYDSLKYAEILSHNGWFECHLHIYALMSGNLDLFRLDFEGEVLIRIIWISFLNI